MVEFYTRLRYSSSSIEFEYRVLRTEHRTIEYRTLELDINSYLHVVPNQRASSSNTKYQITRIQQLSLTLILNPNPNPNPNHYITHDHPLGHQPPACLPQNAQRARVKPQLHFTRKIDASEHFQAPHCPYMSKLDHKRPTRRQYPTFYPA